MNYDFFYEHFHKKFGFPNPDKFSEKYLGERLNFILEELIETADAAGHKLCLGHDGKKDTIKFIKVKDKRVSIAGILDGLVDILYVVLGTGYLCGFGKQVKAKADIADLVITDSVFNRAFIRVWHANCRKKRGETKRSKLDLIKPKDWVSPKFDDLIKEL